MIFAKDAPSEDVAYVDAYYLALGGISTYPMTVIVDENGTIAFRREGSMTYEELVEEITAIKD
jgi:hypothetical protein